MSVRRSHLEMSCGAIVPKKPAWVPGLLLIRNAALSGVSEYRPRRSFLRRSRPTSAFIKILRARGEAPVFFAIFAVFFWILRSTNSKRAGTGKFSFHREQFACGKATAAYTSNDERELEDACANGGNRASRALAACAKIR